MQYKNTELAPRTVSSYAADWRVFETWCAAAELPSLPATEETLELYVTDLVGLGRKITTVERHCYAVQYRHRGAGEPSPFGVEVKRLLCGARRMLAQMPAQKAALEISDLRRILRRREGGKSLTRARNSALLVFGFATALRRSTLAQLRCEDVTFTRKGMLVTVRKEKQDRKGEGRQVAVPYGSSPATCPVRILQRWLKLRGNAPGALFCRVLNGQADGKPILGNRIAQIVQESVQAIGLDRRQFGAHSLRAGFCTAALANGAGEIMVARQTGHASLDTLRLYERSRDLFRGNASAVLGL